MKKAKVLIVSLAVLLVIQLIYIVFVHYHNKRIINSILNNRSSDDIKIDFTDVPLSPPTDDRIIADFENADDTSGFEIFGGGFSISEDNPLSGYYSLMFDFEMVGYPALTLHYLPRYWSNYDKLSISIYNPSGDTLTMLFRIDDHNSTWNYETYYSKRLPRAPGYHVLEFPISDIGGKINTNNILDIVISIEKPSRPGTVYIDDIILRY